MTVDGHPRYPICPILDTGSGQARYLQAHWECRQPGISLEAVCEPCGNWLEIDLCLKLAKPQQVDFIGMALGPLALRSSDRFLGEIPGFLEKSGVEPALEAQAAGQRAAIMGLLYRPASRETWLAGMDGLHADRTAILLNRDRLWAGWRPERALEGTQHFKLTIGLHADPLALLRAYGARLAPLGHGQDALPTGWNTWDFYGGAIRMTDVRREMDALHTLECRSALQYLTIDMGWETAWGDWIPNRRFPARLRTLADKLKAAGWRPGIWVAPFQVSLFTPLARSRQDLFLRHPSGSLIIVETDTPCGPSLLLDFSLPEVQSLIRRWFGNMRKAGFELFKIDYLYLKYLEQARQGRNPVGQVAFLRAFFKTLREAVGPNAHILNCGGLKEAALGYADSARVTIDIHNFWGHIRNNATQLAQSFWMHRNLWVNDPDFAIVRTPGTCKTRYLNMPHATGPLTNDQPFWMRGEPASQAEMRLWLSVVRLNGGSLFLSDSIQSLATEGRADLQRLFPPLSAGFDPLDLFERKRPGIWLARDRNRPTLGLFNWNDQPETLALPPPLNQPLPAIDFWSGERLRLKGTVDLPARSGRLLEL